MDRLYRTVARAAMLGALAALTLTPVSAAPPKGVPKGSYECWAWGQARMNLNFTVTGPGSYRQNGKTGTFSLGPQGKLAFTGPMKAGLPDGFTTVYHEPHGKPTVSFRGPSGSEASFCERAG